MCKDDVFETEEREIKGITFVIEKVMDYYPDLSWIGEFTDKPNWNEQDKHLIIDREARGERGNGEYRYFVCAYDLLDAKKWYKDHGYSKHDCAMLPRKHALEDYERMQAYNRGDWGMMGIVVSIPEFDVQNSLWGIETDSEGYQEEIIQELIYECISELPDALENLKDKMVGLQLAIQQTEGSN